MNIIYSEPPCGLCNQYFRCKYHSKWLRGEIRMFTVKLPTKTVYVSFRHPTLKKALEGGRSDLPLADVRSTACDLYFQDGITTRLIATGRRVFDLNENFCRKLGRKGALAAAMKVAELSYKERKDIWDFYNPKWGYGQEKETCSNSNSNDTERSSQPSSSATITGAA